MFIDTHCHISNKYYNNIEEIINECLSNKVNQMILSCCEKDDIDESLQLIDKYNCLYATFGFHPDQIDKITTNDLKKLEQLLKQNKKIIGVGEIGLDYHYPTDKEKQKKLFEEQLIIAQRLNMPVVIHSRDATQDTIEILKKYKVKGVIHCFSGSLETAQIYIKMGFKLGIGGVVTFKNSNLATVISKIPMENIVLETDSPYLTPSPFRGSTNSPKYIPIIAEKISSVKNLPIAEVAKLTTKNCYELFDLK